MPSAEPLPNRFSSIARASAATNAGRARRLRVRASALRYTRAGTTRPIYRARLARFAGPFANPPRQSVDGLRNGWKGSRPCQRAGQLGEDRQVGMEPYAVEPSHAEWEQCPFVLEPPELALDRGAATVKRLPPLRLARHERMQAVGRDPLRRGLALAGRAAPLGRAARGVRPGERPLAVIADQVVAGCRMSLGGPIGTPTCRSRTSTESATVCLSLTSYSAKAGRAR